MDRFQLWLRGLRTLVALGMLGGAGGLRAQTIDDDSRAFAEARAAGTAEALQRYLEQYPLGRHAGEAFRALVELELAGDPGGIAPEAGPEPESTLEFGALADVY